MCKAFSCIVAPNAKVFWKFGVDSHSDLVTLSGLDKYDQETSDPSKLMFAKVEIFPRNNDYLNPSGWTLIIDKEVKPVWWQEKHVSAANFAHKKWLSKLEKVLVKKQIVHPFRITPPEITKQHINMLRKWASVGDSVWASVRDSVWASVRDSVRDSVGDSVWASVRDSVWASVWASVGDSVRDSVWASVWAYIGSFFIISQWQYIKHPRGKYPFGPAVQLWERGLVPSFDGKIWRLHGGPDAKVLFEISKEELNRRKHAS